MYSLTFKSALLLLAVAVIIGFLFILVLPVHAQAPQGITFPIVELGSCNSVEECRVFCDTADNANACASWGKSHGVDATKGALDVKVQGGPGGCTTELECRTYCSDASHRAECLQFGVEKGLIPPEKAAHIKEQQSKGGPGGCRGEAECRAYCSEPANQNGCIDYAVSEGFMSAEEAQTIKTSLSGSGGLGVIPRPGEITGIIGRGGSVGPGGPQIDVAKAQQVLKELGGGPGGCKDFAACQEFCSTAENESTCVDFAAQHELIKKEDVERFKKLSQAEGPGGCRGRECQNFCNDPAHRDQCFAFAKSNNLLAPEEVDKIEKIKTIQKKVEEKGGPGGCRKEGECRSYCSGTGHFDECAAFAVNEGFLDPDEAEKSLKQFIQIEHFGPGGPSQGFSSGNAPLGPGPGNFPGNQQGLGTTNKGQLPQGSENVSSESQEKIDEQFKSRLEQFHELRGAFEQGKIIQPGDFKQGEGFREGFKPPLISEEQRARFEREGNGAAFPGEFPTPKEFPGRGEFQGKTPTGEFPVRQEFPSKGNGSHPEGTFHEGQFEQEHGQKFEQQQFKQETPNSMNQPSGQQMQQMQKMQPTQPTQGTREGMPGAMPPGTSVLPPSSGFNTQNPGSVSPSSGSFHPPEGSFTPPPGNFSPPSSGSFTPPPSGSGSGSFTPPPNSFSAPSSGSFTPPPSGSFTPPPTGSFTPPPSGSFTPPPTGSFTPPPSGSFTPPPSGMPPPPTSSRDGSSFFANILGVFGGASR